MRASHLNKALVFRRSMEPWVRFENVREKRKGYYVSYTPKFVSDKIDDTTAVLSVRLLDDFSLEECKAISEKEFKYWIQRFNVPLQAIPAYENNSSKRISSITNVGYICGVSPEIFRWGGFLEGELAESMPDNDALKLTYKELPSKSSEEAERDLRQRILGISAIKWFALFTAVLIPALIAFLGWSHPLFSAIALIVAWYKCADKWLSLTGRKIKTESELAKEEDNRLKEHHHYHCKINPDGFTKLKLENFKASREQRLKDKLKEMERVEIEN
ncbi:hypothetical protein BJL83_19700 [Vibrio parahaemolyticus]|nr:hypothetical protein BJL83_19700 [Vibrio parahaemolyticus]